MKKLLLCVLAFVVLSIASPLHYPENFSELTAALRDGNADTVLVTERELPQCDEKMNSKTAYVINGSEGWICLNEEWVYVEDELDCKTDYQKEREADMVVTFYRELPSCDQKLDGKTGYVVKHGLGYICSKGGWVAAKDIKIFTPKKIQSTNKVKTFTIKDPRDGQIYKTVIIGSQTWMAENLNYKVENSSCYQNADSNCTKFGRLYTWYAAMQACPAGFHLPTKAEFDTLIATVVEGGLMDIAGKILKSTSGWLYGGNGIDSYGFSAIPVEHGGMSASFWSFTEFEKGRPYILSLNSEITEADLPAVSYATSISVRCVKD